MNTLCKVTIREDIHESDRNLLAYMLCSLDINDEPTKNGGEVELNVSHSDYSALCILEDMGVLTVEQI